MTYDLILLEFQGMSTEELLGASQELNQRATEGWRVMAMNTYVFPSGYDTTKTIVLIGREDMS